MTKHIAVLFYEQPATARHQLARSGRTTAEGIGLVLAKAWRARRPTFVYDGDEQVAGIEKSRNRWIWWAVAQHADVLAQPRPEVDE